MQLHSCFTPSQRCAFQQHSRVLYSSWHARDIKRRKLKSAGPSMPLFTCTYSALLYCTLSFSIAIEHHINVGGIITVTRPKKSCDVIWMQHKTNNGWHGGDGIPSAKPMVTSAPRHWSTVLVCVFDNSKNGRFESCEGVVNRWHAVCWCLIFSSTQLDWNCSQVGTKEKKYLVPGTTTRAGRYKIFSYHDMFFSFQAITIYITI